MPGSVAVFSNCCTAAPSIQLSGEAITRTSAVVMYCDPPGPPRDHRAVLRCWLTNQRKKREEGYSAIITRSEKSKVDRMEKIIDRLVKDFETGKLSRRQLIQSLTVAASAAAGAAAPSPDPAPFKAVTVNHISYQVADYKKTRDFYAGLLGMDVS